MHNTVPIQHERENSCSVNDLDPLTSVEMVTQNLVLDKNVTSFFFFLCAVPLRDTSDVNGGDASRGQNQQDKGDQRGFIPQ